MNRRGFLAALGALPAGAIVAKLPVLAPDYVPALVATPGLSIVDIVTTTLRAHMPELIENIKANNRLLKMMKECEVD